MHRLKAAYLSLYRTIRRVAMPITVGPSTTAPGVSAWWGVLLTVSDRTDLQAGA